MTKNQILYQQHLETKRSNLVNEEETARSNRAREAETYRHNYATEVETNRSNLAREFETNRHNVSTEQETARSNRAQEALAAERNAETYRHNKVGESLEAYRNLEQHAANQEIKMHNANMEAIERENAQTKKYDVLVKGYTSIASTNASVASSLIGTLGRLTPVLLK